VCPHQGGTVAPQGTPTVFVCDRHSSHFDANGTVFPKQPATSSLVHFAVSVDKTTGEITVRGGTIVDAAVRVQP